MNSVIFDMDGTLFDTERLMLNCWKEITASYNMPDIEAVYPSCIGTNDAMTMEIFHRYYGDHYPLTEIRSRVIQLFHDKIERVGPPLKKHAYELLSYLKTSGYKMALASSTETAQVIRELQLAGIHSFFDVVIGGDAVSNGKPAPDIFLQACEQLGSIPAQTYVIEDSENGIRAAYAAGAFPIMVPDMIAPDEEVKQMCGRVFPDLFSVHSFFLSQF